jgi:D-alanine-D-alanine ligase-like ATP-grasp enzyme
MNYILYSKNESYKEGAEKIKTETLRQNKKCKIIEISCISSIKKLERTKKEKGLLYFLTNDNSIPGCIELLKDTDIKIINKPLLSNNVSKFVLQQIVKKNGICIPKSILPYKNIGVINDNIRYPIFIKSQKQASVVMYTKNKIDFKKNKITIGDLNKYYLEKAIENKKLILNKFYYTRGSIINIDSVDTEKVPAWFHVILNNIAKSLELEVFSVDIFINWSKKKYSCIDINPAPAFFKSDKSRENFVKNILI